MEFNEKLTSRIDSGRVRIENESGLEILNTLYFGAEKSKMYGKLFSKSTELLEELIFIVNSFDLGEYSEDVKKLIKEATTI